MNDFSGPRHLHFTKDSLEKQLCLSKLPDICRQAQMNLLHQKMYRFLPRPPQQFLIKLLQFISIKINFSGFHLPVVKNFQVETCWINEWLEKALTRQLLTYDFSTSRSTVRSLSIRVRYFTGKGGEYFLLNQIFKKTI